MDSITDNVFDFRNSVIKENRSINKVNNIIIHPTAGSDLNSNGKIDFIIEQKSEYLNPSESYLQIEAELLKKDGTTLNVYSIELRIQLITKKLKALKILEFALHQGSGSWARIAK